MSTACIPIEKAKPGMKLAEDVSSSAGVVLCRRGTMLSESMIERLQNSGIEKIVIEEVMSTEQAQRLLKEKKELLHKAFAKAVSPCMRMLKQVFTSFWEEKYSVPSFSTEESGGAVNENAAW
ncbi:MAG: hypothetical protein J7M03_03570 [Candidatus Desulfofervidaceae bacterium]|nr:hypothetical protein [Candidatus Desulfofervidaceae bacterium]